MPRSAVLGACGFLGSHLCEVLVAAGHELLALDEPARVRAPSASQVIGRWSLWPWGGYSGANRAP